VEQLRVDLLHSVEGGSCSEPSDLAIVEGVIKLELIDGAILVLDLAFQRLAGCEVLESNDGDPVV